MNSSELILNAEGAVYHLALRQEHLTDIILTVGDPDRVPLVASYLDELNYSHTHREFSIVRGKIHNLDVLVLSTGMGTDNIDIVMNELDILANIDLAKRRVIKKHRKLYIIRLGTSGSLSENIEPGDIVYSDCAAGFDFLSAYYGLPKVWERPTKELNQFLHSKGLSAYFTECGVQLKDHFSTIFPNAFTLTLPGFYAPQGRNIRLKAQMPDLLDIYRKLEVNHRHPDNIEMETAGYYLLGKWMGHECISINAILANRLKGEFHPEPETVVKAMIEKVLDSLRYFRK